MAAAKLFQRRNETTELTRVDTIETETAYNPQQRYNLVPGVNVVSCLPLQMCLYFNVYYSPFWMLALVIGLEVKYNDLQIHFKYITIVLYVLMACVEAARLYLGYEGNLKEKVAELAGYWILTLFQLMLVIYLMIPFAVILPLDWAVNIPMVALLVVQIVTGVRALVLVIKAQTIKYRVSQVLKQD